MNIVIINNKTEADLVLGGITYEPEVDTTLFDINDPTTYDVGNTALKNSFDLYKNSALAGDITVTIDGILFDTVDMLNVLQAFLLPTLLNHTIGFQSEVSCIYYDMMQNTLVVTNPLTGKKYQAVFSEIVE